MKKFFLLRIVRANKHFHLEEIHINDIIHILLQFDFDFLLKLLSIFQNDDILVANIFVMHY